MKRTFTIIITLMVILLLAGCGSKEKYEPFPLLSKETVSPEREADLQAAMNGFYIPPTDEPVEVFIPTEEPVNEPEVQKEVPQPRIVEPDEEHPIVVEKPTVLVDIDDMETALGLGEVFTSGSGYAME